MRHPQWQVDTPKEEMIIAGSLGDSLKDVHESYLRLSINEWKSLTLEHNPVETGSEIAEKGDPELQDQVSQILNKIKKQATEAKGTDNTNKHPDNLVNSVNKYPLLRRQRRLFVIALDFYDDKGIPDNKML